MTLPKIITGLKPWMEKNTKVLWGVFKQALFALTLSAFWSVYYTFSQDGGWKWPTFIASFGSTLAILSILSSQWFRVSKQMRDQDNFGRLNDGVDSIITLMEALNKRQQSAGNFRADPRPIVADAPPPPIDTGTLGFQTNAAPPPSGQLQPKRIDDFYGPEDYFEYAHDLLAAGQDYPAAWLAAQGFERSVRDIAAKFEVRTNDSLTAIIRSLPKDYIDVELLDELLLLARVRNNLAHPVKSHKIGFETEMRLPGRVIQSFEIGSRRLRSALR